MRLIFVTLLALFALIQYPLWFGQGGWLAVWEFQEKVTKQRAANEGLRQRNLAMEAEVEDLRSGTEAVEERARTDLGLLQDEEVYVQILPADADKPK
ncbi:MAG: cell division protein FtsB [Orrella sp.]